MPAAIHPTRVTPGQKIEQQVLFFSISVAVSCKSIQVFTFAPTAIQSGNWVFPNLHKIQDGFVSVEIQRGSFFFEFLFSKVNYVSEDRHAKLCVGCGL